MTPENMTPDVNGADRVAMTSCILLDLSFHRSMRAPAPIEPAVI